MEEANFAIWQKNRVKSPELNENFPNADPH